MQTNLQDSSTVQRTISLFAIAIVTLGIGLGVYAAGRPVPADANADRSPVASLPAQLAVGANDLSPSNATTPHFERSNEPAIEVDPMNAHGG